MRYETYLSEQGRLIHQAPNERNYHVFYQMLGGTESYGDYAYLKGKPTEDDATAWPSLTDALSLLGMPVAVQQRMFDILLGVLLLGSTKLAQDTAAGAADARISPDSTNAVIQAAGSFNVKPDVLATCITKRIVKGSVQSAVGVVQYTNRTRISALRARDRLAKIIYVEIFQVSVECIRYSSGAGAK